MPGPFDRRGQGVGTLFEDRFPDVRRAVDPNLFVHYEILNVDVEFDSALVGIGDYERDLAPLSGLDVGDLHVELEGRFGRFGESSRQVELERVELCEGGEIGRARLTLDKDHRRFAQRDRGDRFGGELVREVFRARERHLDVAQRADDLFEDGVLVFFDRKIACREIDRMVPVGEFRGGFLRTDLQFVTARRKLHLAVGIRRFGSQIGIRVLVDRRAFGVEDLDDEFIDIGLCLFGARLRLDRFA